LISVGALHELATEHADDVVIFDARFDLASPESGHREYVAGHLPGARYLHLDADLSGVKSGHNGRHPLPDREQLARTFGAHGLSSKQRPQVVVYDAQGGMFASRAWWLLRWLGYERVAVLDGGIQAWLAAGLSLDTTEPARRSATFLAADSLVGTVDAAAVFENLLVGARVLIDARAPDRYRGENETLDPVGGHIPGARNRFFKDNLAAQGTFKSAAELREEFERILQGAQAATTIHQCGSGVTACHNLLAMEVAGLSGATLYPGSWSEWVADRNRPIAKAAAEQGTSGTSEQGV